MYLQMDQTFFMDIQNHCDQIFLFFIYSHIPFLNLTPFSLIKHQVFSLVLFLLV